MPIGINGSGTITGLSVGGLNDGVITPSELSTGAPTWDSQGNVGNITSINSGPLAGFRNAIINGNFDVWQRGTSFTGSGYGADRWIHSRVGTTHTASQQAFTLGQTSVPGEPQYFCRTIVSSVAGAGNSSRLLQRIESVRTFANQQITLSFWAKADASRPISVELAQDFGTGGSPSSVVTGIGVQKTTLSTSWQKITVTATVPSISGKTLGSDDNNLLALSIWFDAGSDFNARTDSLGQQSGTFDIAQVQVEAGPIATPFERRPIGTESALCQRYYLELNWPVFGGGAASRRYAASSTNYDAGSAVFPVTMRALPTATIVGTVAYVNASNLTISNQSPSGCRLLVTAGGAGAYSWADPLFTFDAEL